MRYESQQKKRKSRSTNFFQNQKQIFKSRQKITKKWNLFDCENRKKDEPGGMGWMVVAALTSDIRRGRADTAPFSSSFTKPSVSSSSVIQSVRFCFTEFQEFSRKIFLLRLFVGVQKIFYVIAVVQKGKCFRIQLSVYKLWTTVRVQSMRFHVGELSLYY